MLIVFVAALLALGLAWCTGVGTPSMMNLPRPFNSTIWKTAKGSDTYVRCSMVWDLRHRIGLIGRTRTEVIALLGNPEYEPVYGGTYYSLCPSMADIYVLDIEWQNGRVSAATVHDT